MRKIAVPLVTAFFMTIVGAGAAMAYSFGPLTVSHDGSARGDAKGKFYQFGWDGIRLEPTLKDRKKDDMHTFAEGKAMLNGAGTKVQSGRRGDGKNTWATLTTRTAHAGTSVAGFQAQVKVCMDRSWAFDPCKSGANVWW